MGKINGIILKIKESDFWSKLFKNVTMVLVGNGGSSIINLIVTIIMTRCLGNTSYGIFLISLQYMNLLDGIFNFQSWAGVIKYGSEAAVERRDDKLAAIFKSGFIVDIVTAIIGTIIALIILPLVVLFMKWDGNLPILAVLFSVEILFHIEGTSVGILRLYDKFSLTAKQAIIAATLKLVLVGGYLIFDGKSLIIVTILYVVTDIIKHLMLVIMALLILQKRLGIKRVIKSSVKILDKSFLKYTLWNNISYTADVPVKYFDVFIISLISVDMVAIYKVFKQIILAFSMLVNPISQAILPQFSELVAMNRTKEALTKVLKLRNAILAVGAVAVIGSLILGRPVFTFILGKEYGDNLFLFMVLFCISIMTMSYTAIHPFFASLGVAKIDFIITAVSNVVYMIVAIGLVKVMGIYSIILATGMQGASCVCMKYRYTCNHFLQNRGDK